VNVTVQTPLKRSDSDDELMFYPDPPEHVFFRGTVRITFLDENGVPQVRYIHLVEKQGTRMPPIIQFELKPHVVKPIEVTFIYPADCTPPQVLTVSGEAL
jgi:hypothetical protein